MDAQEIQDLEKLSTIWAKNLNSTVNNTNKTISLMVNLKSKDDIKLDIVELNKSETYPEANVVTEDGLYKYMNQPLETY